MNRTYSLALLALLGIASSVAHAVRPTYDYRCLAQEADYVLIVTPTQVSENPILGTSSSDLYLINLHVVQSLKGIVTRKGLEVSELSMLWAKNDPHAPRFSSGDRFLVFVEEKENGPLVINGSQGARKLDKGKAFLYDIGLSAKAVDIFIGMSMNAKISCPRF